MLIAFESVRQSLWILNLIHYLWGIVSQSRDASFLSIKFNIFSFRWFATLKKLIEVKTMKSRFHIRFFLDIFNWKNTIINLLSIGMNFFVLF